MKPLSFTLAIYFCGWVFFTISGNAYGQSERMEELKEAYEKQLKKAIKPVDRQYQKALIKLQKKFIAENRLEDALLVKREIELLKENKVVPQDPPVPKKNQNTAPPSPAPNKEVKLKWKGDQEIIQEGVETIYALRARKGGVRLMTLSIEDIQKQFPNGLKVRFQYKSSGFVGQGVEMRMEFPTLRGLFTYRNPTLKFDGEWNEYLWPFSDTKGQEMMNFHMMLEDGEGTIQFKNFEFLAN